jgi:hypothetical protein
VSGDIAKSESQDLREIIFLQKGSEFFAAGKNFLTIWGELCQGVREWFFLDLQRDSLKHPST